MSSMSVPASDVGLGCVTFGREINETAAHVLLDHAYARGVRFYDTASAYGNGESERILGSWLTSRKPAQGSLTVATKILPPYEPGRLEEVISQRLERLDSQFLDILYLHRWDATADAVPWLAALDSQIRSGNVRRLGVSNYDQGQLEAALTLQDMHGLTKFSVIQNNHNLAVRDMSAAYRHYCAAQGVQVVTYSPLGAGFLTGKHRHGVEKDSRFDVAPGHQDVYFHDEAWARLARLESVAARTGYTPSHLALAWAMHQPGVDTVLVGGRTPAHLEQALAAQGFDDPDLFLELSGPAA